MHGKWVYVLRRIGGGALAAAFFVQPAVADQLSDAVARGLRSATYSVVGTVTETRPARRRSPFGDDLIITTTIVQVSETLRGGGPTWVSVDVEGGTLDGITMEASDTPMLKRGDRAVLLLDRTPNGQFVTHGRGAAILPLGPDDRVMDSVLTLGDLRRIAREDQ